MSLATKVKALESAAEKAQGLCEVRYKHGRGSGSRRDALLPMEKALAEAREGKLLSIFFPLTPQEEKIEDLHRDEMFAALDEAFANMK